MRSASTWKVSDLGFFASANCRSGHLFPAGALLFQFLRFPHRHFKRRFKRLRDKLRGADCKHYQPSNMAGHDVVRDAGLVVAQIVEAEVAGEDLVGKRTDLLCYSDRVLLLKRISVVGS